MRKKIIIPLAFIFFNTPCAFSLQAYFSYAVFHSPGHGSYIETYLLVDGRSVAYNRNPDGNLQGKVAVSIRFSGKDSVAYDDKYNLLSPGITDTAGKVIDFIDQQRIWLPDGTYLLELSVSDKNKNDGIFRDTVKIDIACPPGSVSLSDIEFISAYSKSLKPNITTKNGFDMLPHVSNFYPSSDSIIGFYAEIYNTDKAPGRDTCIVSWFICQAAGMNIVPESGGFVKKVSAGVNPLLAEIAIKDLPSGNYYLIVQVKSRKNEVLASKKIFFQRSNIHAENTAMASGNSVENTFASVITSVDTLTDYIESLRPVSDTYEVYYAVNQLNRSDLKLMQQFFYEFWIKRKRENPFGAWSDYLAEVRKVNAAYGSGIIKGYATDRGRIYLRYGPPNSISGDTHDPSAFPYEIWHYYHIKNKTNRRFVFYNPELAGNNYILLHSDFPGELYDAQWQLKLHKRDTQTNDMDTQSYPEHFGGKSNDLFKNPR